MNLEIFLVIEAYFIIGFMIGGLGGLGVILYRERSILID